MYGITDSRFTGFTADTWVGLLNNEIRELTEESFRPMLEVVSLGTRVIHLYGQLFILKNSVQQDLS